MSRRRELIEALKEGKPIDQKKCPICGSPLKIVMYGYMTEEIGEFIRKNKDSITNCGCMCFADDRDPLYICRNCKGEFTETLEQIILMSCPLEASNVIRENECRNYELLESRAYYKLLDDRELICDKICPLIGKKVRIRKNDGSVIEGELRRTFIKGYSMPGNCLLLSTDHEKYGGYYKEILISEIGVIEQVPGA